MHNKKNTGVPGFEPGMPVSKTDALTTWLYPKKKV